LAVSDDYARWFVFDASPDIHRQIEAFSALQPREGVRDTPIQAVLLSDAELDHTLGLLSLREGRRLRIYATEWVHRALTEWNRFLPTLSALCAIDWQPLRLDQEVPLLAADGSVTALRCRAFSTHSTKRVAFSRDGSAGHPEASVGFRISDARTGRAIVYVPAVESLGGVREELRDCVCLFFDGTCWTDAELADLGISGKTSRQMGHLPVGGNDGSLAALALLDIERRFYIHINNTNPMLAEDSAERQAVRARGLEVAHDGLEVEV
jgi:pyrroloquinoline quinone biosynthesis protein B